VATRKKTARRRSTRRVVAARAGAALARLEQEFPSLREFSRQVGRRLNQIEREVERVEAVSRRRLTHVMREASHELGRLEAQGEKRWRALTTRARRDALDILKRLERALEGAGQKPAVRARRARPQRPAARPTSAPPPPASSSWPEAPGGGLP
jgi:hypothetical protein